MKPSFVVALSFVFCLGISEAKSDMPKVLFLDAFRTELPKDFCKKGSGFRLCFPYVEELACRQHMKRAVAMCTAGMESIYTEILSSDEIGKIGSLAGACVAVSYQEKFSQDKKKTDRCLLKYNESNK